MSSPDRQREITRRVADNLARVRQRLAQAVAQAGRHPAEVTLVAVTKYVDAATTRAVLEAGCRDLGESRPQELWRKASLLADEQVRWHQIGHLQRNKAERTLECVHLIHAGDSQRLLRTLDQLAARRGQPCRVLLEVNVSGDPSKHGFAIDELEPLLPELAQLNFLRVLGLMAMAGWGTSRPQARRQFARLRELRDSLRHNCPAPVRLDELSMGMSGDYEEAVAEGATLVRIGSALYEGLDSEQGGEGHGP